MSGLLHSHAQWGPTDQIGAGNLLTPERRLAALGSVQQGRVYDLSHEIAMGAPNMAPNQTPFLMSIWASWKDSIKRRRGMGARNDAGTNLERIEMTTHVGTHIDALNHFGFNGRIWNNFEVTKHLGSRTWDVCGAEKHPPIIARGIMLDLAALHRIDVLPPSHGVGAKELDDCLRKQGTELRPGDVVLLRTGQMKYWLDTPRFCANSPGLNREGAEYLCKGGAIMIGSDTLTLEQVPSTEPGNYLPVHCYMFAEAGVPIMEMAQLDELAADKIYEFAFIGACIKLRGATGSPMRPVAMPLRD